jgi:hypothetical protein
MKEDREQGEENQAAETDLNDGVAKPPHKTESESGGAHELLDALEDAAAEGADLML